MPGGNSFVQSVVFEALPSFCTRCGSAKHFTEGCPLGRVEKSKQRVDANVIPPAVEPTSPAGSGNPPESNGADFRPEVNADHVSSSQQEGNNTNYQVNHESRVKDAKGKGAATDLEGNSSDDETESSYVDSSLYGFTDSTLLDPIAFLSNIEDGVFGTRSNIASAAQGAGKQLKR
nr:hypothetical protein Iba_scaffold1678407CG0010 [Ipomoea batatas]